MFNSGHYYCWPLVQTPSNQQLGQLSLHIQDFGMINGIPIYGVLEGHLPINGGNNKIAPILCGKQCKVDKPVGEMSHELILPATRAPLLKVVRHTFVNKYNNKPKMMAGKLLDMCRYRCNQRFL